VTAENEQQIGASYPYVTFASAMEIAEAVKELGGAKVAISRSLLASHLKQDEKAQAFTFKIGAAKIFGMIEGRSSFTLTENAKRFFYPTNERDKTEAALAFLSSPPAFAGVIERYDGTTLPAPEMLANVFHREYRVPESWKARAATFFTRTAQSLGAIDERGILRVKGHLSGAAPKAANGHPPTTPSSTPPAPTTHGGITNVTTVEPGYHSHVLPLQNGRRVTVHAPLDISGKEIARLAKWLPVTLQVDWEGDES
jgi:hypothetical protein